MFLSIQSGRLPRELSAEQRLEIAVAAGFSGIELMLGDEGPLSCGSPPVEFDEFAKRCAARGLRITGLASGAFFQSHYASADAAGRQAAIDRTLRMLDLACAAGTDAIVVIPAVVGRATDRTPQISYVDALRRAHEALAELRHEAESRGVTIAIENVWNRFLLSPVEAADFVDRVNSPYVGWCLDTGNVAVLGYAQDWIRTLAGRIARVHVKDYDPDRPGRDGFVPLGEGSVDWATVRDALRDVRYRGPLTYEGPGEPAEMRRRMEALLSQPNPTH